MLTNKTNIIRPLARAIEEMYYSHPEPQEGIYYVTELLKGPRAILLNRMHYHEVEKDIQEIIDSFLGTAKHKAIELLIIRQEDPDCLTEQRIMLPVDFTTEFGDTSAYISGAIDLIFRDENGDFHIVDWKECKLAKADKVRAGEEEEWKKQVFLYAWLIEQSGISRPVDAKIYAFPKDLTNKEFDITNPAKCKAQEIVYDLSDREYEKKVLEECKDKLKELYNSSILGEMPRPCTDEEKWQRPPTFAVKKPDSKSASKVCSSVAEAQKFLADKGWIGKGYMIYERPSQPVKCCDWCDAKDWCNQGKKAIEEWENSNPKTYNDKGVNV